MNKKILDLSLLINAQLPRMSLPDILNKVRQENIWKSYVALDTLNSKQVLGGCVIREHQQVDDQSKFAELFLLAVDPSRQSQGLGRRILQTLKDEYSHIVTFADLRAVEFFTKMEFKNINDPK